MKYFVLILSSLLSINIYAADCSVDKDSISISWKAFKTPAKAGVMGSFKTLKHEGKMTGSSIDEIIKNASLTIETNKKSVHTKNKSRDAKIAKFFFSTMSGGEQIKASVKQLTNKRLTLAVTMNNQTIDVPMNYKVDGLKLEADGVIDVFDFKMIKQLEGINKACKALHEGKTWNDVEIFLSASFKGSGC